MSTVPPPHEQELNRLRQELQAARDALGDFAYVVSHDLRANLRHITAYAALVREELPPAAATEVAGYLETVTQAAKLMGRQIDGLMAWSKLDRAELEATALDLPALVEAVRQDLAAEVLGRTIEWQVAQDMPPLQGDAMLVRQLLGHLLSNALKFTRSRTPAVIQIGCEPSAAQGWCALFVRDNGVGFQPQQGHKLFHVFQRLHSAKEFEGLGLGLALARKIVERHGGRIEAEGAPDAGCCIRFTLPLAG